MTKVIRQNFILFLDSNSETLSRICRVFASGSVEYEKNKNEIVRQLWRSFPLFINDTEKLNWIYRIGINTVLLYKSGKNKYHPPLFDNLFKLNNQEKLNQTHPRLIYTFIDRLSIIDKTFTLLFLERRSASEIAWITGISEKNAEWYISDIRGKIERILDNE